MQTNTKVKLLIRSHAMRESTSPPREPNGGSPSPRSPQSPSSSSEKKLNNNETIYNSNLTTQSPKTTRTTATSPTCRIPSRNGQCSPSTTKSAATSPTTNHHRSKATSPHAPKCNNCVKNNQNDKCALLQTPHSPSNLQYSKNPNNRRQNSLNQCTNQCSSNSLSVNPRTRHKLRHQNSSQGSGSLESNNSPCLSRDSSTELYTDSTGIDLEQFIAVTINRNQKDRSVLLKIEKELIDFAKDRQKPCHKFPNMSSYNRMLVHRVAAYFGMEHNVDQSGLSVIVTRTKNMRIPDTRFKEHIRDDLLLTEEPRRSILKRDSSSFEDGYHFKSPDRLSGEYCRRSKSFEEREEEYEKARRRIFKDSSGDSEVTSWPYWSSSESSEASARYRLLHPGDHHSMRQTRLSKGESCDGREAFRGVLRPSVSKSFSFGGYTRGMLSRGDSVTSTRSAGPRLTKQDSGASSRLSPSSSGYKSQSQRSDATISPSPSPSPVPTIPCSHSSQNAANGDPANPTVMWAVSSISSVPPGSLIMNPRTNQPYTNADGSVYRFDPENPPKIFHDIEEIHESPLESPEKFPESPRNNKNISKKLKNTGKSTVAVNNNTNNDNNNHHQHHRVTNTATSPTLPFSSTPPPQECPPSAPKSPVEPPGCVHTPINQSYANYSQTNPPEVNYGQTQPYASAPQQGMVLPRHHEVVPPPADVVFSHGNPYGNYSMVAVPQGTVHGQNGEVNDLSGYFMGMNVYEQPRNGSEGGPPGPQYPAPPPPPPPPTQNTANGTGIPGFWQPQPPQQPPGHPHTQNQVPGQGMYFVPPATNNDRQGVTHQRFGTGYAYNSQGMSPASTNTSNYVNSYQIPYNSMPTVGPTPPEYPYQAPLGVIPTYYPAGQPGIQPPVMWRVPTPPNTPNGQMPGIPVMYVNNGTYPAPGVMTSGGFGHQLAGSGTPGPQATYMAPSMLPNMVFRQNVPMVASGIRASTPSGSQRTSRSPTPGHEFFNNPNGGGDNRNAQTQPRYPLPMYQGLHIVQGKYNYLII